MAAEQVDSVVIGAGVVGLAVARALSQAGRDVLVLESADAIGTGTSSRNSEVIHAGLYYPTGSIKARACVEGSRALYRYCDEHGVTTRRCGKVMVASGNTQIAKLNALHALATANGVADLVWLTPSELRALEPELVADAAFLSPSTGIVDSHGYMLALQGDLEEAGGVIAFATPVERIMPQGGRFIVATPDLHLEARIVVNAAGHGAPRLAATVPGLPEAARPRGQFAKGNYFALAGRTPFRHLVYPMPNEAGLGTHATLDLQGRVRFGPDVEWVSDDSDYHVDPARAASFYEAIRAYWPALPDGALEPAYAGIRPKLHGPGEPMPDFRIDGATIHGLRGLINLLGIESPGLTASLALARMVTDELARDACL